MPHSLVGVGLQVSLAAKHSAAGYPHLADEGIAVKHVAHACVVPAAVEKESACKPCRKGAP